MLYETLHRTILAEPESVVVLPGHVTVTADGKVHERCTRRADPDDDPRGSDGIDLLGLGRTSSSTAWPTPARRPRTTR